MYMGQGRSILPYMQDLGSCLEAEALSSLQPTQESCGDAEARTSEQSTQESCADFDMPTPKQPTQESNPNTQPTKKTAVI